MQAGFAKVNITPPLGTHMSGFGYRDKAKGSEGVHDDLFVRAVFAEQAGEPVVLIAYDLLFFPRAVADRIKGAIGRVLDLLPRQILLNTSHTHVGPSVGSWGYEEYLRLPDPLYVDRVVEASVEAAVAAFEGRQEVTLQAGQTRTTLPVSRRYRSPEGPIEWRPAAGEEVCDSLPVCVFRGSDGQPVCVLFSISCHPSTTSGFEISADYPGVACRRLDEHFGKDVALFLQGCAGDTKASVITDGAVDGSGRPTWRRGNWDDVERAGRILAEAVLDTLEGGLRSVTPLVRSRLVDMGWPLGPLPSRADLEKVAQSGDELHQLWAKRQLTRLDRGQELPQAAPVLLHGITLGQDLRLVALEGEPVAGIGHLLLASFDRGITFPLGYSNGQGLYLPTERMLAEGGYEVESAFEYGFPANLTHGYEQVLKDSIGQLQRAGIR